MLISIHIPKTGGATLHRSVLEPAFGDRLLLDYADAPLTHPVEERNRQAQAFEPAARLADSYDCIHGHFLASKYRSTALAGQFAAWFRDPVQWALSRFHHGKRAGTGIVTAEMSIWEFSEIERFHNPYAAYLHDFDMGDLDFVGIVEHYAESLDLFGRLFAIPIPENVRSWHRNPAKERTAPYRVKPKLAARIRQFNRDDVEIYESALSIHRRLENRCL